MPRLRSRGPNPTLADSEVVTLELVGEFWGLADDQALDRYFRRYHAAEFPALSRVHRPSFVRPAANLCGVKRRIQRRPAERLSRPEEPWLVDSLPLPVCCFARACTCRRFAGLAGWGYDPVAVKPFSGFRRHVRTSPDGVIQAYQLAAADAAETEVIWDVAPAPLGVGLGDRNDGSPARQAEFQAAGGRRLAPFKTARYDPDPRRSNWLLRMRRRIEHSSGQLVERFRCRRLRVKDLGHLEHRLVRKIHLSTPLTDGRAGRNPLEIGQPI